MEQQPETVELRVGDSSAGDPAEPTAALVAKPPRSYAEIKLALKSRGATAMTGEESKIYWRGNKEESDAKKQREEAAEKRYWACTRKITGNILVKALCYLIYGIWTITPIIGIVIGIIYVSRENCPANSSIAPLLIVLGLMSTLVGISFGSKKAQESETPTSANADAQGQGQVQEVAAPSGLAILGQSLGLCAGGCLGCFIIVFKVIHVILFLVTCGIVYGLFGTVKFSKEGLSEAEVESLYCNEVLYLFAFWSVTISLAILCFLPVLCCCVCVTYIGYTLRARKAPADTPTV